MKTEHEKGCPGNSWEWLGTLDGLVVLMCRDCGMVQEPTQEQRIEWNTQRLLSVQERTALPKDTLGI